MVWIFNKTNKFLNKFPIFKKINKKKIKNFIWDIDGTMYRNTDQIFQEMINITCEHISKKNNISKKIVRKKIEENIKNISLATIAEKYFKLDPTELATVTEKKIDRCKYIKSNKKLIDFIEIELSEYNHIILTNASTKNAKKSLKKIGFSTKSFLGIYGIDNLKEIKPSLNAFKEIINNHNLKISECIMIGDSLYHDIHPAKKLGLKTCFITSDKYKQKNADLVCENILDLKKIFK